MCIPQVGLERGHPELENRPMWEAVKTERSVFWPHLPDSRSYQQELAPFSKSVEMVAAGSQGLVPPPLWMKLSFTFVAQ
jgi:hypothetical protein